MVDRFSDNGSFSSVSSARSDDGQLSQDARDAVKGLLLVAPKKTRERVVDVAKQFPITLNDGKPLSKHERTTVLRFLGSNLSRLSDDQIQQLFNEFKASDDEKLQRRIKGIENEHPELDLSSPRSSRSNEQGPSESDDDSFDLPRSESPQTYYSYLKPSLDKAAEWGQWAKGLVVNSVQKKQSRQGTY